jgi:ABC-type lipoprotein release transport system permease subunit
VALIGTRHGSATLAVLSLLLTTVTTAVCFIPAQRGTRVDPASTLRQD